MLSGRSIVRNPAAIAEAQADRLSREDAMQSIRYGYLGLAAACLALAIVDHNYREFAVTGGLFLVAEAILQLRER